MKTEIAYLITADSVIVDNLTNKPSVIGFFDVISKDAFVAINVFAKLKRIQKGEHSVEIVIQKETSSNENDPLLSVKIAIPYTGTYQESLNLRGIFPPYKFDSKGKYNIKIFFDGVELDSKEEHSFDVI